MKNWITASSESSVDAWHAVNTYLQALRVNKSFPSQRKFSAAYATQHQRRKTRSELLRDLLCFESLPLGTP